MSILIVSHSDDHSRFCCFQQNTSTNVCVVAIEFQKPCRRMLAVSARKAGSESKSLSIRSLMPFKTKQPVWKGGSISNDQAGPTTPWQLVLTQSSIPFDFMTMTFIASLWVELQFSSILCPSAELGSNLEENISFKEWQVITDARWLSGFLLLARVFRTRASLRSFVRGTSVVIGCIMRCRSGAFCTLLRIDSGEGQPTPHERELEQQARSLHRTCRWVGGFELTLHK